MHLTNQNTRIPRRIVLGGLVAAGPLVIMESASAATPTTLQLQNALSVRGIPCGRFGIDGSYGASTSAAVTEYQKLYGLVGDGKAGPKTWAVITANPKPHPSIIRRLTPRWSESGTIAIVDKMGRRGSPLVSNVARAYLFREGQLIRTAQVRTGGRAYDKVKKVWRIKNTPTGAFRIQTKIAAGYSNTYDAAMPWFVVFNGDIGFHYSPLGFRVANYGSGDYGSMGCVNIGNDADAKLFFSYLAIGRNQVVSPADLIAAQYTFGEVGPGNPRAYFMP